MAIFTVDFDWLYLIKLLTDLIEINKNCTLLYCLQVE